jgi:hypothetical protein
MAKSAWDVGYQQERNPELKFGATIGAVPLLTGLFGTCPIYTLLGANTCPRK